MTVGQIAGLLAALAACVFVGLCAVPLLKLGRVFDELSKAVRDLGEESVPILTELKDTVTATNTEIGKLGVLTDDVATMSGHATAVSENVANVSRLVKTTVATPIVKATAMGQGVKTAVRRRRRQPPDGARRAVDAGPTAKAAMRQREAELRATYGLTAKPTAPTPSADAATTDEPPVGPAV